MKKNIKLSLIVLIFLFAVSSCRKEPVTTTKTINVELKSNDSYSYIILKEGDDDEDDVMKIVQQAMNYSVSKITPDASENILFEYVPAKDFSGTDEVRISNEHDRDEDHHRGGHHGSCHDGKRGHDNTSIYIFKFNIRKTL